MRKILCYLLFSLIAFSATSQQLYLEMGRVNTKFDYINSDGSSLQNVTGKSNIFMALGYNHFVPKTRVSIFAGLAYNKYGANSSDELLNNYFEWDLSYIAPHVGLGYEFFKPLEMLPEFRGFTVTIKGAIATEFMLKGSQMVNNLVYDLNDLEPYKSPVFYYRCGVQVNYYLSKNLVCFAQLTAAKSARIEELLYGKLINHEELRFKTQSFGFGIAYCIRK